jgi:hypothetical protein
MFGVYVNLRYWATDKIPRWHRVSEAGLWETQREAELAKHRHHRVCVKTFGDQANPVGCYKVFNVNNITC